MIRVSSSKWMLLALVSVMLTTNLADTAFEAELGHPDVQFSENTMEGVRLARGAPKTPKKPENPTTVTNSPITVTAGVNGGAGGVTVPTQPPDAAANSGVGPSTTEPPPDTNMTNTTTATEPTTVETTNATTLPTTAKTTEPIILTTKPPSEVPPSKVIYESCKNDLDFSNCVNKQLSCQTVAPLCFKEVTDAAKKAVQKIDVYMTSPDSETAKTHEGPLKETLKEEADVRCHGGDQNSCNNEWEKTLKELIDCSKPTTQRLPRCLPKKTVPTPTPPTPEAPNSTDIHEGCKGANDVQIFDTCAKKQILVKCPSATPCDSKVVSAVKTAARRIYEYNNCGDPKCAKGQETALKDALEKEENARCTGKPSCPSEAQKTLDEMKKCTPDIPRCLPKSLDIFESCPNDDTYAECVDQQLDCRQTCPSTLAEISRTAAHSIDEYNNCGDLVCAAGKRQQLDDALFTEMNARCKDSQCVQDWNDWLITFTDCSLHLGASRCKPATTTTTPAPPSTTEIPVPPVTTLLPNNNSSSTSSSQITNSTQLANNTTTSSIASQTPAVPVFPPGGSAQTSTSSSTDEQDPGTEEYVPPHEDLPEDFSCQNLGEKYKACEYLCKQLASLKPYEEPGIDWRFLPGAFMTAGSLLAIPILFFLTKRMTNELAALNQQTPTAADDPNAKLKIAYAAALDVKDPKNPEKKEEKSQEVPSPPSLKNNPAAQKMRAKLLETQQNLQKLRTHAKKCVEEHKKDAASSKFQKKGAIYIPNEPEIPPPAPLPDNIILDNVEWCSDYNEMYVIGSDVDDIELDQDYVMNPDSFTTDDDEDKSKKSQKSKNSKKSKKSAKSKKSKKDVPSTSGAPSAAPPASTTSAPSTSTPSADAKRESNQNKSKEQQ